MYPLVRGVEEPLTLGGVEVACVLFSVLVTAEAAAPVYPVRCLETLESVQSSVFDPSMAEERASRHD